MLAPEEKIRQIKFPPKFTLFRPPPNYIPAKFKDIRHPPNFIPAKFIYFFIFVLSWLLAKIYIIF